MELLRKDIDADFVIQSGPLSQAQQQLLQSFIRSYKKKRAKKSPRRSA